MALLVAAPIVAIALHWIAPDVAILSHLWQTQIPHLLANTLILAISVGVLATLFGVSAALLVSLFSFKGRVVFEWLLVLPLAMPAYVLAFVYLGLLDYSGPVQQGLASLFDTKAPIFMMDSPIWVSLVFALAFYPYIYLSVRAALQHQGWQQIEAARSLGASPYRAFIQVLLPSLRAPWIAGLALVLMEVMADFGTVAVFNFDTFTTAIYRAWFGLYSLPAAAQLASLLLGIVALLVLLERIQRKAPTPSKMAGALQKPLKGHWRWFVPLWLAVIVTLGILLPVGVLLFWWAESNQTVAALGQLVQSTLTLGLIAAAILIAYNLTVALLRRPAPHWRWLVPLSQLGYAFPGSVLAVGVMLSFAYIDSQQWLPTPLLGTAFALMAAYVIRFNAVSSGAIEAGIERIPDRLHEAGRSLGASYKRRVATITLPLLAPSVFTAALMVMVDVMKEMPATLLLRPFGYDTLAVRIYEYTSEGEWQLAAVPSLVLLGVGLIPTLLLIRQSRRAMG